MKKLFKKILEKVIKKSVSDAMSNSEVDPVVVPSDESKKNL